MKTVDLHDDVDLEVLAESTEGYSGADLANVCRDSAMNHMRRFLADARKKGMPMAEIQKVIQEQQAEGGLSGAVTQGDFLESINKISSSVGTQDLKKYEKWMAEFGSA